MRLTLLQNCTLTILLLSFSSYKIQAQNYPDTGISLNFLLSKELSNNWFLSSINNYATKDKNQEFAIGYADLTLGKKFNKTWSIDAGYRHAWIDLAGRTRDERRPLLNFKWKKFTQGWFLLNRFRIEWRDFEEDRFEDRFRLRNQFLAVSPWKIPSTEARWFIEEEAFFEMNGNDYNMNWFTSGFQIPINESSKLKLGYRWMTQKLGTQWFDRHQAVIGLNLRL